MGWICIVSRSPSTRWTPCRGRCGGAGCGSPTGNGSVAGCVTTSPGGPTGSRWRWRWRAAPVGATWSRRSRRPGSRRTWPSRPTRRRRGPQASGQDRSVRRPAVARVVAAGRAARVVDPAGDRVGVAGTGPAVQVAGRSTPGVDPTDPRRAVPARRRRPEGEIRTPSTRAWLASDEVDVDAAARQRIAVGYAMIDATDTAALPLKAQLQRFGMHQPACRALVDTTTGSAACWRWRCGPSSATVVASPARTRWCATPVWTSPSTPPISIAPAATCPGRVRRRCGGRCSKRPTTRPARGSPDHDYYSKVKDRHDGKLAAISVARQFARRCYHLLRNIDPDVVYADPA